MKSQQEYTSKVDHPLRYSEYVSKDRLLQHLNDLSIDSTDCKEQNVRIVKWNILKMNLCAERGQTPFMTQRTGRVSQRETAPSRQALSRQSTHFMNKKSREIRMLNYAPPENADDYLNNPELTTSKSLMGQRNFRDYRYGQKDLRLMPEVKGVASSLQINNNQQNKFRSTQHKSMRSTAIQRQKIQYQMQHKMRVKPTTARGQKQTNLRTNSSIYIQPQGVIPNSFKTKLPKKCVEDNLNIMASMIKKKVKVLNKEQMYSYINHLMSRHIGKE